ncbi:MAG TPA: methyltransferase domain-containing protein [Xanthobacteraceae bacterium]|nr:methyltransferase domain-containing protein [Xanthobacteraceae bacterium]
MSQVPYILGHSESELRRLMRQAAVLAPITRRLLSEAGLARGMRVLDVGCGAGDVSLLAATVVGPAGSVVGIDHSKEALAHARERARAAGHDNIEFRESGVESFTDPAPFEFAVGRYVLIHQADPAAFIRSVAAHVRPGGVVAFHEIGIHLDESATVPEIPLWSKVHRWIMAAFRSAMRHPDAGGRMIEHFHNGGLRRIPEIFVEIPAGGGPDSPLYGWAAHTLRSLMPQLEKIGVATAAEIDIDTLEERLRRAVVETNGQVVSFMQFCGWTRV